MSGLRQTGKCRYRIGTMRAAPDEDRQ